MSTVASGAPIRIATFRSADFHEQLSHAGTPRVIVAETGAPAGTSMPTETAGGIGVEPSRLVNVAMIVMPVPILPVDLTVACVWSVGLTAMVKTLESLVLQATEVLVGSMVVGLPAASKAVSVAPSEASCGNWRSLACFVPFLKFNCTFMGISFSWNCG